MSVVYSKMLFTNKDITNTTYTFNNSKSEIIIKNKNHNTCSGTAFIKP